MANYVYYIDINRTAFIYSQYWRSIDSPGVHNVFAQDWEVTRYL